MKNYLFTSESVSEGHPDKLCDQISDAVLDECLMQDPESRVACECMAAENYISIAGEISTHAKLNWDAIARGVVDDIGYTNPKSGFSSARAALEVHVHRQSPDIAMGVSGETGEQGAGDQGMMFGFACNETEALMPAPIYYSHRLMEYFSHARKSGECPWLGPDGKTQLTFCYADGIPVELACAVVSLQHAEGASPAELRAQALAGIEKTIPGHFLGSNWNVLVNPTGRFVLGGPAADAGLTGRKIIVDTYGGMGRHGGGAFSGKDPSKVDRSAAYMCRYVAKNIVAAGLASRCEIQVAYAIGMASPVSISVDFFGTGGVDEEKAADILMEGRLFDFRPAAIIERLGLKRPDGWHYRDTAAYGHFGRSVFPWERTDAAADINGIF